MQIKKRAAILTTHALRNSGKSSQHMQLRKHLHHFDSTRTANPHNTCKLRNALQILTNTCKLRKHLHHFDSTRTANHHNTCKLRKSDAANPHNTCKLRNSCKSSHTCKLRNALQSSQHMQIKKRASNPHNTCN